MTVYSVAGAVRPVPSGQLDPPRRRLTPTGAQRAG
jgi:hypothetical protein